ncbi:helix-turn-helix domain-containing protein [Martelella alba]|uniref:Helix-turn-helix domain-containing protein n=1 Tax=Martelella alba TaxID=2590451 RepID=A0A506U6J1_9HYPH|nr:XRE family transcriptional regulator [Martelella alba]TPW28585.1 helix-turn-helix domain-containing protein [Martelella alba]
MTNLSDLGNVPTMNNDWKKRIEAALQAKGMSMKAASLKAGRGETFVRDMLKRNREPSFENLKALARVLDIDEADLDNAPRGGFEIPLMGYVGAGAQIEPDFEQVPPEGLEQITMPLPMPADMIAFQVRGSSMLPVYRDGMVIVVFKDQKRPIEWFFGREAVVRTADGRRFIKTIMRGSPVTLTSFNAAPIEGTEPIWLGEIFAILPQESLGNGYH